MYQNWKMRMSNRRTAILMLKYLLDHGKTENDNEINKFTNNEFERRFIPLAAYWSNDVMDLCFEELGIVQPQGAYNSELRDAWYAWFEKTINALELPE